MEEEKLNDLLYKIPLIIKLPGNKEYKLKELPYKYNDFRKILDDSFKISLLTKLEYRNSFGEVFEINSQQRYLESLACTNGQAHYIMCTDIILESQKDSPNKLGSASFEWMCPMCSYINLAEHSNCMICDLHRPL